jgi:hypothetical protein
MRRTEFVGSAKQVKGAVKQVVGKAVPPPPTSNTMIMMIRRVVVVESRKHGRWF